VYTNTNIIYYTYVVHFLALRVVIYFDFLFLIPKALLYAASSERVTRPSLFKSIGEMRIPAALASERVRRPSRFFVEKSMCAKEII
jgi:hypothetical protein